jgi:division protein CdvB (Snf7/Vps24/ESCRT-III family)
MDKKDVDSLIAAANKIKNEFLPGVVSLINENLNNGIGLLLFKVYYQQLSPETREAVEKATKVAYYRKDKQLRNMTQPN